MTDLYGMLGLSSRATQADIKSAYRRLARKFHPDVSASPDANARFAKINEAYQVLSDPARRAVYDHHGYSSSRRIFYASRDTDEVVAKQREFERVIDKVRARERQEERERMHAVFVVVPLFLSGFYVMLMKPTIVQQVSLIGRILIVTLAIYGLVHLVKNLSIVLARYTYHVPTHFTSVFREPTPQPDKAISRKAGLVFLICGYLVSIGLGYVSSKLVPFQVSQSVSLSTFLSLFLYPPIVVLIVDRLRRKSTDSLNIFDVYEKSEGRQAGGARRHSSEAHEILAATRKS